ncbi:flippase [Clostridium thermarum]|uniref:flippase n=1 Tax=Clostridium thermarum TaxID=1716543 RepID=UPI001124358A|nr:flippase [Clostridium thermarum]
MLRNIRFSTFFKNFFYVSFGNITSQILNFAIMVYVANVFGPGQFGIISFVNIVVMYFFYLASFGLYGLGVIEASKNRKSLKKTVDTIVSLRIVLAIIVFILLCIVTLFIQEDKNFKIMLLINGLTILGSSFYIDWVFNGIEEMKYSSISVIIKNVVYCILIGALIGSGISRSIYIVPISLVIATFASSGYLFWAYIKRQKQRFSFRFNIREYKALLGESWPFFFNGIFALVNLNMDTLMLGVLKTNYEVGLYNSVYRIASALILVISFFFTPVYPMLISNFNEGKHETLTLIINKLRKLMITICIPIFLGAFILNKEIMSTLYKDDYLIAANTFTILMVYIAILSIREIYGYELNAWGQQKKYMKAVSVSAVYNIIGNALLIPHFGIEGAAINTLISEIINYMLMKKYANEVLKIQYENRYILKILISGMCLAATVYLMKLITANALYIISVAGTVYFAAIFLTKAFTLNELKELLLRK